MNNNGMKARLALAIGALLFAHIAPETFAATQLWNAASGNWSENGNWSPGPAPTSGDVVFFNSTGSGGISTNDIAALTLRTNVFVKGAHTLDLAGNSLTAAGFMVVGSGGGVTNPANAVSLVITNGSLTVTNVVEIGMGMSPSNNIALAEQVYFQVGQDTNSRAGKLQLGTTTANCGTNYANFTAGRFFNAYVTNLVIGASGGGSSVRGRSVLDLSAVTNQAMLDVACNAMVGAYQYGRGDLLLSDALDFKIGSVAARGGLYVCDSARAGEPFPAQSILMLGQGGFYAYVTNLHIGFAGEYSSGMVYAANAHGIIDVSNAVRIGTSGTEYSYDGTLILGDGLAMKIGASASSRGLLHIKGAWTNGGSFAKSGKAWMAAGTNRFEAYLTSLEVANVGAAAQATLNIGNVREGSLNVSTMVKIGVGSKNYQVVTVIATNPASTNFAIIIGDPTARAGFYFSDGSEPRNTILPDSPLFAAGGSFSAYLTNLVIARNTVGAPEGAHARFDLSRATCGTWDISEEMLVATGAYGRATVWLPALTATVSRVSIGSTGTDSTGLVFMAGTRFAVTNSIKINGPTSAKTSQLRITAQGSPAGLDLTDSATLQVGNGLIAITFQDISDKVPVYWGLRWQGDHVADLIALTNTSPAKLTWSTNAVVSPDVIHPFGIFLDNGVTYVGARMNTTPGGTMFMFF